MTSADIPPSITEGIDPFYTQLRVYCIPLSGMQHMDCMDCEVYGLNNAVGSASPERAMQVVGD